MIIQCQGVFNLQTVNFLFLDLMSRGPTMVFLYI